MKKKKEILKPSKRRSWVGVRPAVHSSKKMRILKKISIKENGSS